MGTKVKTLDLNALMITASQYRNLFGGWIVIQNVPVDKPDDEVPVVVPVETIKAGKYKVTALPWVNVRSGPGVTENKLTTLLPGKEIEVAEVVSGPGSGKGWGKVEVYVALDCLKKV